MPRQSRMRVPDVLETILLVEPAFDDAWILGGRRLDRLGRHFGRGLVLGARLRRMGTARLRFARLRFAVARLELRSGRRGCAAGRDRTSRAVCRRCAGSGAGFRPWRIRSGFAVSDELIVARCARTRRCIRRQTASPMRPIVGHVAGQWTARAKHGGKTKQCAHGAEPFDNHSGRRVVGPARRMHRARFIILSNCVPDRLAGH